MPGSPLKRARKMGLPVPNCGDKPPRHPRARARELPSDAEIRLAAKRTLLAVLDVGEPRDQVMAARVLLEATKPAERIGDDLDKVSDDELAKLAAEAGVALDQFKGGMVQ